MSPEASQAGAEVSGWPGIGRQSMGSFVEAAEDGGAGEEGERREPTEPAPSLSSGQKRAQSIPQTDEKGQGPGQAQQAQAPEREENSPVAYKIFLHMLGCCGAHEGTLLRLEIHERDARQSGDEGKAEAPAKAP
jgi:hypothetical protein